MAKTESGVLARLGRSSIYGNTLYGGGKAVKQLCAERGWGWLAEEADRQKGKIDG